MKNFTNFMQLVFRTSIALLIGSSFVCGQAQKEPEPTQSEMARIALIDWLECEECTENQLENVLKQRELLQPMLISVLQKGVAPASRELYTRELEKRYDELVEYSRTHKNAKPTLPKQEFVNLYLGNLTAQYQTRAAIALGAIANPESRKALEESLPKIKREDVKKVVQQALKNMK